MRGLCRERGHPRHRGAWRGHWGPRAPTLGSWSSGIEKKTDWLNVSWAWLLFMMEIVFFTTCPGRTAPNFTILLAGSRTKICGTRKTVGVGGASSVKEEKKQDTCTLLRQGRLSLSLSVTRILEPGWAAAHSVNTDVPSVPLNDLSCTDKVTAG